MCSVHHNTCRHCHGIDTYSCAVDPAVSPLDPYQNSLVMPLAEFIEHPLAHELIHNGQTLQVVSQHLRCPALHTKLAS